MEITALIVSSLLVVLGVLGSVLPLLPGVPLIVAGYLLYGFATRFMLIDVRLILIALGLTLAAAFVDLGAGALGAKRFGASAWGIAGGTLGTVLGIVVLGPVGLVVGPVAGAILGEMLAGRTWEQASRAGIGGLIGFVGGSILRLIIALSMAALFFMKVF